MNTPPTSPPFAWTQPWTFTDVSKANNNAWSPSKAAERKYERQLLSISARIQAVLKKHSIEKAEHVLRDYAKTIDSWAHQSASNMVLGVRRKNDQAWQSIAKRMGLDFKVMLASPGVGQTVSDIVARNARSIRSLVLDAADSVGELVKESMATGIRAESLVKKIAKIGQVSENKARTIARTEISKASTVLTQERAKSIGSTGYIWRTALDGDTRDSHRAMEGVFVPWDKPPVIDGMVGHAGEFPNCRCYPEPVVPKDGGGVYTPPLSTKAQGKNRGSMPLLSQWERTSTNAVTPHIEGDPLVNTGLAIFDKRKLSHYALNEDHPKGGHKAKLFKELLGMTSEHADLLEKQLMAWVGHAPAVRHTSDDWGDRFKVHIPVTGPNGKTVDVTTGWIYARKGSSISTKPKLVTAYIRNKGQKD